MAVEPNWPMPVTVERDYRNSPPDGMATEPKTVWRPSARLEKMDEAPRVDPVSTSPHPPRNRSVIEFLARLTAAGLFAMCAVLWLERGLTMGGTWPWLFLIVSTIFVAACVHRIMSFFQT